MHLLYISSLFAGLAAALPAEAPIHLQQRQSGPASVQIAEIAISGSGCTTSSQAGATVSDPTSFTVPQQIFVASSGANSSKVVDSRTNCHTILKVNHAAGWQFSVAKADYYGRVHLGQGAEAISKTTYSFSGVTNTLSRQYYFDGPFDGLYFRNDRFIGTSGLWSACGSGASLNISSEVRVAPLGSGSNKPASMEIFNFLGSKVGISWRKCT